MHSVELVDWTGRIIREDKKGVIPDQLPDILLRLNMDGRHWLYLSKNFEHPFRHLVGAAHQVRAVCKELGKNWVHGIQACEQLFSSG